jgi:hypothetical protein
MQDQYSARQVGYAGGGAFQYGQNNPIAGRARTNPISAGMNAFIASTSAAKSNSIQAQSLGQSNQMLELLQQGGAAGGAASLLGSAAGLGV